MKKHRSYWYNLVNICIIPTPPCTAFSTHSDFEISKSFCLPPLNLRLAKPDNQPHEVWRFLNSESINLKRPHFLIPTIKAQFARVNLNVKTVTIREPICLAKRAGMPDCEICKRHFGTILYRPGLSPKSPRCQSTKNDQNAKAIILKFLLVKKNNILITERYGRNGHKKSRP